MNSKHIFQISCPHSQRLSFLFSASLFLFAFTAFLFAADSSESKNLSADTPTPSVQKTEEAQKTPYHWDFTNSKLNKKGIPENWSYRGKPFTPDVKYELVKDASLDNRQVLKITADKATGAILLDTSNVDLEKYPVLRWRWKAEVLPSGADARIKSKDDQGIAIFAGYGRLTQKSISYCWQTETPAKVSGKSTYNGVVDVTWYTKRNKLDKMGEWYTEEVNLLLDMKDNFGKIPSDWALSVSSNSQYTESSAVVYLDYIEFVEKLSPDAPALSEQKSADADTPSAKNSAPSPSGK